MPNTLEETTLGAAGEIDPAAPPIHPSLSEVTLHREADPRTLSMVLFNNSTLPWRLHIRQTAQAGREYQRMQVEVLHSAHTETVYTDGEPLTDRKLRLFISALFNLRSWDDLRVLERSEQGLLVGVPPGYLAVQEPKPEWPYPLPPTQEGYPLHRVIWDFENKLMYCTCGQGRKFALGNLAHSIHLFRQMAPMHNNTMVCPHKELVLVMQHSGLWDTYEIGEPPLWFQLTSNPTS